jgi:hypothetical protein
LEVQEPHNLQQPPVQLVPEVLVHFHQVGLHLQLKVLLLVQRQVRQQVQPHHLQPQVVLVQLLLSVQLPPLEPLHLHQHLDSVPHLHLVHHLRLVQHLLLEVELLLVAQQHLLAQVILINFCFVHPIFRFWFLVTKLRKYYVIFVYILQGKMGKTRKNWKENHGTKVTKIPKTKRRKYGMNETFNAIYQSFPNFSSLITDWFFFMVLLILNTVHFVNILNLPRQHR